MAYEGDTSFENIVTKIVDLVKTIDDEKYFFIKIY